MRITLEKILQWLLEGRGQGHDANYIPWIKIVRKLGLSKGHLELEFVPLLGRQCHYLSKNELRIALLLLWLKVADLREQFPCWPTSHPHPLYLHPHFHPVTMKWSDGTLSCARSIGVKHPYYSNTTIHYIPTIDLMATIVLDGVAEARAFDVKPDEKEVPLDDYDLEKLAIKKEYCKQLSIPWKLVSSSKVPETLATNLQLYVPYSGELDTSLEMKWNLFLDLLNSSLSSQVSLDETLRNIELQGQFNRQEVINLFRRALWFRETNIDLREAIVMSEPPNLSDHAWVVETNNYLFGG
jgi:hypothetical protein